MCPKAEPVRCKVQTETCSSDSCSVLFPSAPGCCSDEKPEEGGLSWAAKFWVLRLQTLNLRYAANLSRWTQGLGSHSVWCVMLWILLNRHSEALKRKFSIPVERIILI